jgi:hypothetical protein
VQVGTAAEDAFGKGGALGPGLRRALFSPDGQRLAVIGDQGIGIARAGSAQIVTPPGSAAVDAAWMPDSRSLLVVEGPAEVDRLTVLDLDGRITGVARLDTPFSVGRGSGVAVDARGARAVVTVETRDAIGGRPRHDLVLVDLTTGRVRLLTDTADAEETWPVLLDDSHVVFARREASGKSVVVERDLESGAERRLSPVTEDARPLGVTRAGLVYASLVPEVSVTVWALPGLGRAGRVRLARLPAEAAVWTVDPSAARAVATLVSSTSLGERTTVLRAVTLTGAAER